LFELLKSGIDVNIAEQKSHLRNQCRQKRKGHVVNFPYTYLLDSPEFKSAAVIASYISYGDEPNTVDLNAAILGSGKKLLLPRINTESQEPSLDWVAWQGDSSQLISRGKILEPIGPAEENSQIIDIVIIPALQIDSDGFRLGQGGGFYDRALRRMKAWKIALIFSQEFSTQLLPREDHDVAVNAYATDEKIFRFN
jgi:5-formyltetrahydrofolate cyclo-ligase